MIERKHPVAHLTPHRCPRVAGQTFEPAINLCFVFGTTTLSDTSRAHVGFDAREAAALRLNHLNIARWARRVGAGSRLLLHYSSTCLGSRTGDPLPGA